MTGLEPLRTVMKEATIPVIAIGGIFPENLPDVLRAGARDFALVRHFTKCADRVELRRRMYGIQQIQHTHEETTK